MRIIFSKNRGMTMVELMISLAVFALVVIAVGAFESNVFIYKETLSESFQTTLSAQTILKTMLVELREAAPGDNGAYPLISAASSSVAFFTDVNNDGHEEKVTYTFVGPYVYKAVIPPSGNPPVYNVASQSTTTLFVNARNSSSTPVFQYYDTYYTGTSSPLVQPVTTTNVRLIKISLTLDQNPNRSPLPLTYTVQASLRNLKNNL